MIAPRRRDVLLGMLAAALSPRAARASSLAVAGRLNVPGLEDPRPGALSDLLREVEQNSSVSPESAVPLIDATADALFGHPFVVLNGDRGFDPLPDEAIAALRLYLREGGFLFVDDNSGIDDSDFDRSVRRDLARILPGTSLGPIGRDHAVYRSFFLLRTVPGRIVVRPHLEGMWHGDITPVLYSRNDLLGGLWRSRGGGWALEVVPGGRRQRAGCRKLGINVVLFALTGNYKRDVVHVDTLLKRMRRQGGYAE
jgi:hypothetical protein